MSMNDSRGQSTGKSTDLSRTSIPPSGGVEIMEYFSPSEGGSRLDYRIVVNWVIAAHKSQGTMQLAMSRGERERFFVLDTGSSDAHARAATWFEALTEPQFTKKVYGASAGTNASSN